MDDKPVRILVLSPWGLSGGYSGPIVLLNRLFSALVRASGASVDVLYRNRGIEGTPEWVAESHALVDTEPTTFDFIAKARWILRVRRYIREHAADYDVIHVHGAYMPNVAPFLGLSCRTKVVVLPVLDCGDLNTARRGPLGRIKLTILRHVIGKSGLGLSLAPGITKDLARVGIPVERVMDMPNIVDVDEFHPRSASDGRVGSSVVLGFVGKMGETKQPHLLIDALLELRRTGVDARALFVGPFQSAQYELEFMRRLSSADISNFVQIVDYCEDVAPFFRKMDIFVLPSKAEGMPGALVEAMACGLPCIVTDVGSMGQVVQESNAGWVVLDSGSAIAAAVANIANSGESRSLLGKRARAFATKHFSHEAVALQYLNCIYEKMRPYCEGENK